MDDPLPDDSVDDGTMPSGQTLRQIAADVGKAVVAVSIEASRLEAFFDKQPLFANSSASFEQRYQELFGVAPPSGDGLVTIGSGVLINGWVITNAHLVPDGGQPRVTLLDGQQFTTTVRERDEANDLVVLEVNRSSGSSSLPSLSVATSAPAVGQWTAAVGRPFSVTTDVPATPVPDPAPTDPTDPTAPDDDLDNDGTPDATDPDDDNDGVPDDLDNDDSDGAPGVTPTAGIAAALSDPLITVGVVTGVNQTMPIAPVPGLLPGSVPSTAAAATLAGLIRTDAEVNPGSSGGALVDMSGRLLGVTVTLVGDSPVTEGLGFAIPRDKIAALLQRLPPTPGTPPNPTDPDPTDPDTSEAWIGITVTELTPTSGAPWHIPSTVQGVLIVSVASDSPASRATLRPGDVIQISNGRQVTTIAELRESLRLTTPGQRASFTIWRSGGSVQVNIIVIEQPGQQPGLQPGVVDPGKDGKDKDGTCML